MIDRDFFKRTVQVSTTSKFCNNNLRNSCLTKTMRSTIRSSGDVVYEWRTVRSNEIFVYQIIHSVWWYKRINFWWIFSPHVNVVWCSKLKVNATSICSKIKFENRNKWFEIGAIISLLAGAINISRKINSHPNFFTLANASGRECTSSFL